MSFCCIVMPVELKGDFNYVCGGAHRSDKIIEKNSESNRMLYKLEW